jgi:hypothetical protein
MFQAAVMAAEENAPDEVSKAKVLAKYRRVGNAIIRGSLAFLVAGVILFYVWRVYG